jgi:hypothetical protein
VGSTPTRFRQKPDDSIAFVGVRTRKTPHKSGVLDPTWFPNKTLPHTSDMGSIPGRQGFAPILRPSFTTNLPMMTPKIKPVNLGRHKRNCTVCAHAKREEIEQEFVSWKSPKQIAEEYGLADRVSVCRHAHALGLMEKRKRNVRAALEKIIEKARRICPGHLKQLLDVALRLNPQAADVHRKQLKRNVFRVVK